MKIQMYKCENCGAIEKHIDMYNAKYCYNCIDIDTGELKEEKRCKGCGWIERCDCGKTANEPYSAHDSFQDRL